ncbi:Uma2 family endonuclease [Nostoc sp. TCL26-01]|uniref:Uma2 family endonuclease n=1 Tax=Nostoc sp. TCL26-01 TaxID=2576904 RepID=UPI0015BBEABB|nr:Uma2 family endonuclease [Nostoc sp. TCL26-01]QLE55171.1 Uma2 family endonuclease [Nostoc sp. TCL26-01]
MVATPVKKLTFEEYLAYDDGSGFHHELVDGRLELMNPPTFEHCFIAKFLEQLLDEEIKRLGLPWLTCREVGVRTGKNKSRLTDLCVAMQEQVRDLLKASAVFESAPLLIVEVVSPDSIKRDYRYKRSEYAAVEVPEYWIVDPLERKISVLLLEDGLYEETVFTGDEKIISRMFPEIAIAVAQVLKAGNI